MTPVPQRLPSLSLSLSTGLGVSPPDRFPQAHGARDPSLSYGTQIQQSVRWSMCSGAGRSDPSPLTCADTDLEPHTCRSIAAHAPIACPRPITFLHVLSTNFACVRANFARSQPLCQLGTSWPMFAQLCLDAPRPNMLGGVQVGQFEPRCVSKLRPELARFWDKKRATALGVSPTLANIGPELPNFVSLTARIGQHRAHAHLMALAGSS